MTLRHRIGFLLASSVLVLFGATGCISTQATRLGSSDRPSVSEDAVRVYRTAETIGCEYEEVAIINAQGSSGMTNENQMIRAAKKRAAKSGANALVLSRINEPSAGAKVAGAIFGVSPERRGEMIAVYVHEPCRPTGVAPAGTTTPSGQ